MKDMLVEVVEKILKNKVEKETVDLLEDGKWATDVWQLLLDNELTNAAVSEEAGGAGGDVEDLFALYTVLGRYAAPVPFIEHTLANYLLTFVQGQVSEPLTTYSVHQQAQLTGNTVTATLQHVPWARYAERLVLVASQNEQQQLVVVDLADADIQAGTNVAAEPRDRVTLTNAPVVQAIALSDAQYKALTQLVTAAALSKASGAIDKAFELTVRFSKEREQFGRPIHRFQLVQQHLAMMAGEQALMTTAVANVLASLQNEQQSHAIAYARVRLDDAIKVIATSAHQVHAAIGMTHEHSLHHYTRRLWAWRDEDFTMRYWKQSLVADMLASNTSLWASLTGAPVHASV